MMNHILVLGHLSFILLMIFKVNAIIYYVGTSQF